MTPQLQFTITEATLAPGGIVIHEPEGWEGIKLVLRRSEYHSLVEFFEGEFIFVGDGFTLLQSIRDQIGAAAKVTLTVAIRTEIDGAFTTFFTGLIDISMHDELTKFGKPYKFKAPITQSNNWTKLISRLKTPVNLMSELDLDGDDAEAAEKITLPLPSQKLRSVYERSNSNEILGTGVGTNLYLLFDCSNFVMDEVANRFNYGMLVSTVLPTSIDQFFFKLDKKGEGTIDLGIGYTIQFNASVTAELKWWYQKNDEAPIQIGSTHNETASSIYNDVEKALLEVDDFEVSDKIFVWGELNLSASRTVTFVAGGGVDEDSFDTRFKVTYDTVFRDTVTDSVLLKEAFKNVLAKVTGVVNPLTSDALDGCRGKYALQKIMHLRGFTFDDKPFVPSFDKLWKGAAPALALGFGYKNDGTFEIEKVEDFYSSTKSLSLDSIGENVSRGFNLKFYINLLKLGFAKWSAESPGGIDDPQTIKTWRTIFPTIGKPENNLSEFYAASLGMEQARRNRAELTKDFRLDEEICIIAVKADGDDWTPEVGTDFEEITDLLNSDTRYNIRLFVSRIFKRWQIFYEACLFQETAGTFYFAEGEGNFKVIAKFDAGDCEVLAEDAVDGIAENADFKKSNENSLLIHPNSYSVVGAPLTFDQYETIRDNRKESIGIPYNGEEVTVLIEELSFTLYEGKFDAELFESSVPGQPLLNEDGITALLNEDGAQELLNEN